MLYKQIMVAVDGSNSSNLALQEAIRLTQDQQAKLRIIYVVDKTVVESTNGLVDFDALWNFYKEEAQDLLNIINEQLKQKDIIFETYLVELKGSKRGLAQKILAEAQSWPADILVVGTQGRHGITRLLRGSIAESVARIATMPVLLIRDKGI